MTECHMYKFTYASYPKSSIGEHLLAEVPDEKKETQQSKQWITLVARNCKPIISRRGRGLLGLGSALFLRPVLAIASSGSYKLFVGYCRQDVGSEDHAAVCKAR